MALWARLRSFWHNVLHRSDVERNMSDELQFHLECRARDLIARGGLSPAEAMRLARLEDWVDSLPDGWNTFVGEAGILRLRRGTTAHRPGAGVPRRVTRDRARRANGSCGSDVDPHVVP